ncbi:MAG: AHH domain-containing protein [Verrucomicrobia bacterium]|nr:AHH domain-containing protein [Verrucomicrobiota bacterium]
MRKIEDADSTQPNAWSYKWDAMDQLLAVTRPDGQTWNYKYDAFQRRILKSGPTVDTVFVWAGDLPVHELQLRSKEWTGWLFHRRSFSPLGMVKGDSFFSVVTDHLGTPQELVSGSGRVSSLQGTSTYGKSSPLPSSVELCPFRFPGQYYDSESGLHYSRFRYYDPGVGSFISQDPIRLLGDIDLYRYSNNPANEIDPFGLSTSSDSQKLGANLTAAGEPPRNPGDEDAHHIVMSNSQNSGMQELRDTMANYNPPININDPENGVWLPRNADARDNGDNRTLHKGEGLHSDDYKESVYAELMAGKPKPPSRRTFLARLQKLKNALNSGRTFKCKG